MEKFLIIVLTCCLCGRIVSKDSYKPAIYRMDIATKSYISVQVTRMSNPIAIDYDYVENRIYWTDVDLEEINSIYMNGTYETNIRNIPDSILDGLAVDSESRLVFYTDTQRAEIVKMKMDGSDATTLFSSNLQNPRAISVDSSKRKLYWTDWGEAAKIETANYDGTNRTTIIDTGLVWPNGIAVDHEDECKSSPCENNGNCTDAINGYSCTCDLGYSGVRCETDVDDCISNPCQNGANCTDGINYYNCTCLSGFSGANCENVTAVNTLSSGTDSALSYITIIGLIIGTVLATVSLFVGVVVVIKRKGFSVFNTNDTAPCVRQKRCSEEQADAIYANQIDGTPASENKPTPIAGVQGAEGDYANLSECSRRESNIYETLR